MDLHLESWRDFYVMIGTASGAIVGATFVVATLAGGIEKRTLGLRGFITPTAVHLGSVLVVSAILSVPTLNAAMLAILLGIGGVAGAIYGIVVIARIASLNLGIDDWIFYAIAPVVSYAVLAAAALCALSSTELSLNLMAGSLVALLIIGMRNAWDMATFMILGGSSSTNQTDA